jgi:hypothetical protein
VLSLQVHTRKDAKYSLKASYLEIYNEGVYDLVHFNPKAKSLPVKWDASYGFYVQGLKVVPCSQLRTMMEVRLAGLQQTGRAPLWLLARQSSNAGCRGVLKWQKAWPAQSTYTCLPRPPRYSAGV